MTSLIDLFHASPEDCFEEITRALKSVDQAVQRNTTELQKITELVDRVVLGKLSTHLGATHRSWSYDVRLPNKYFADVFEVETTPEGAKRWVGAGGIVAGELLLPRAVQYNFAVQVVDFALPDAESSFTLTIDGKPYPWLSITDRLYRTTIQEAPELDELAFSLSVAAGSASPDGVTFSFARISVEPV